MPRSLRFSPTVQLVLEHFIEEPASWQYGYAMMTVLRISSGTLYPILMRLSRAGWLEMRWESPVPDGRPRRRLYRLAGGVAPEARALLARWAARTPQPRTPRTAT